MRFQFQGNFLPYIFCLLQLEIHIISNFSILAIVLIGLAFVFLAMAAPHASPLEAGTEKMEKLRWAPWYLIISVEMKVNIDLGQI